MTRQDDREMLGGARVTVLVVDDQTYFRDVMRQLIETTEEFELVGEAASGEAALEAVDALSPALVIMDKRMPGMGGVEACRRLAESRPEVVVVLISIEDPDERVLADSRAGAFVRKQDLSPAALRELWGQRRTSR